MDEQRHPESIDAVAAQLAALGVEPGVVVVHTAFSKLAPIERGPEGLIAALEQAVGPGGTIVMPSMSANDDELFDPRRSPCTGMGVVAETFWRREGVLRSDSPHAFAASGPQAAAIIAPHAIDIPHGPDSPVGRVHDLDGQVLLLGVGHDANTTVHLAENLAGVRYRRQCRSLALVDGRAVYVEYAEPDHCCERFALLDEWLDARQAQRRGPVGRGEARLARARDVVAAALGRLQEDELVFLHPPGRCGECDDARASLTRS